MSMAVVHINDTGTVLQLGITENGQSMDLSSAITKWIKFQKKDRTTYAVNASFITDGTDGMLEYVFSEGELDVKGTWSVQAYIVMPNGKWHTTTTTFDVESNIIVALEDLPA